MKKFSILVNTIDYDLINFHINSIRKNSDVDHDILVWDNVGDPRIKWLCKDNRCAYFTTGINEANKCMAYMSEYIDQEITSLSNDDMYVVKGWDIALYDAMEQYKRDNPICIYTCTTIMPPRGLGIGIIPFNAGKTPNQFNEKLLYEFMASDQFKNANKNTVLYSDSLPFIIDTSLWHDMGYWDCNYYFYLAHDDFCYRLFRLSSYDTFYMKTDNNAFVYHFAGGSDRSKLLALNKKDELFFKKFGTSIQKSETDGMIMRDGNMAMSEYCLGGGWKKHIVIKK